VEGIGLKGDHWSVVEGFEVWRSVGKSGCKGECGESECGGNVG